MESTSSDLPMNFTHDESPFFLALPNEIGNEMCNSQVGSISWSISQSRRFKLKPRARAQSMASLEQRLNERIGIDNAVWSPCKFPLWNRAVATKECAKPRPQRPQGNNTKNIKNKAGATKECVKPRSTENIENNVLNHGFVTPRTKTTWEEKVFRITNKVHGTVKFEHHSSSNVICHDQQKNRVHKESRARRTTSTNNEDGDEENIAGNHGRLVVNAITRKGGAFPRDCLRTPCGLLFSSENRHLPTLKSRPPKRRCVDEDAMTFEEHLKFPELEASAARFNCNLRPRLNQDN